MTHKLNIDIPHESNDQIFDRYMIDVDKYTDMDELLSNIAFWNAKNNIVYILYDDYSESEIIGSGTKNFQNAIVNAVAKSKLRNESVSIYALIGGDYVRVLTYHHERGIILLNTNRKDRVIDYVYMNPDTSKPEVLFYVYHNDIQAIGKRFKKVNNLLKDYIVIQVKDKACMNFNNINEAIQYTKINNFIKQYPCHIYIHREDYGLEYVFTIQRGIVYIDPKEDKIEDKA